MMKWIKAKDKPFPKDGANYLAFFKGQVAIMAWDEDTKKYSMAWMPNTYDAVWELDPEQYEHKITHWAVLEIPEDVQRDIERQRDIECQK